MALDFNRFANYERRKMMKLLGTDEGTSPSFIYDLVILSEKFRPKKTGKILLNP
jgi:hypothetical protein